MPRIKPVDGLTQRMVELLLTYAEVGSVAAAAERLSISESTFKNQLSTIYKHLGANSAIQALYFLAQETNPETVEHWKKYLAEN